jgi:NADH:ubiquinone oxidoreductase subunit F (NADH-binding)
VPRGADLAALVRHLLAFAADESCGRCVPCRAGTAEARRLAEEDLVANAPRMRALLSTLSAASLCGFGRGVPGPLETLLARVAPG